MLSPDPASPSGLAFPAAALAPAAVLGVVALVLAAMLHRERLLSAGLREELTELRVAHRRAASRETLAAGALKRVERLEETVEAIKREAAEAGTRDEGRVAELERVIFFLRGEINAAHETIERLKQGESPELETRAEIP